MSDLVDLFQTMRLNAHTKTFQIQATYGELSVYNPATGYGKFRLPLHPDDKGIPTETGFLQVGTMFTGPGYGMQFVPPVNAQALVLFIDVHRIVPIAAVFLNNDVETPPFPDGTANGWLDAKGNYVKTSTDGKARLHGASYASVTGTLTELGAESLDATQDAVITERYLSAALASALAQVQTAFNTLAAHVQSGSGTTPPTVGAATSSGSQTVRAKA